MQEWYRPVKVFVTSTIDVLVNDAMSDDEQAKKMQDVAIDYVESFGDRSLNFEGAEFSD